MPRQFDDLVRHATARDATQRYADADAMRADLETIVEELGLPDFHVPAPRNSAQHLAATRFHSRRRTSTTTDVTAAPSPPVAPRQLTRELTADQDWSPLPAGPVEYDEYGGVSGQFAGIEMSEFYWARQRARRVLVFWVLAVLTATGLVAAAAWMLGSNIGVLI